MKTLDIEELKEIHGNNVVTIYLIDMETGIEDVPGSDYSQGTTEQEYFLDEKEAFDRFEKLKKESDIRDRFTIKKHEISLSDIDDEQELFDQIWSYGEYIKDYENEGNLVEGKIILQWAWGKYVGYNRVFKGVRYGRTGERESSLAKNPNRTFHLNETVINDLEDIQDSNYWKWEYFKNLPTTEELQEQIF
jgi:hypothetical protein